MICLQILERSQWRVVGASLSGAATLAIACVVIASGCSRSPTNVVTGRVTYRSQPVAGGRIYFNVRDGVSVQSAAITADGTYIVKGLAPGTARVAVVGPTPVLPPSDGDVLAAQEPSNKALITIPRRYRTVETSGIEVHVEPGSITHDIVLD
jgi:hypothetical protein